MERRSPGRPIGPQALGVLLVVIGALFLLRNAGWFVLDWSVAWPMLVIAFGAWLVFSALRHRGAPGGAWYVMPVAGEERLDLGCASGRGASGSVPSTTRRTS